MKALLKIDPAWTTPQRVRLARPLLLVAVDRTTVMARRIAAALRSAWQDLTPDPRGAYLSQAENHADLERRLRAWDAYDSGHLRRPPTL